MAEEVVRAKSFEVVDDAGNVRAITAAGSSGEVGINLFDSSGTPRVSLAVNEADTPTFGLHDADGTVRIDISSGIDGQIVRLNDENGNPRAMMSLLTERGSAPTVTLMDEEENARLQLQVGPASSAVIGFNDQGGELQVALGLDGQGQSVLLYHDEQGNQVRAL